MKNDKWLIAVDLDGTTLSSHISDNAGGKYDFHEKNKEVFKKLDELGHKVIIVTGRNWNETQPVYEALNNNNLAITSGGARISLPNDDAFDDLVFSINREILEEIFNDDILKNAAVGFDIDLGEKILVHTIKENNWSKYLLSDLDNTVEWNYENNIKFNPQMAHIAIDFENYEAWDIVNKLRRKYGGALLFRAWGSAERGLVFIELTPVGASKGSGITYAASFYNIRLSNTMAFGDGVNDKEMFEVANIGVAMKNSKGTIRFIADDVTYLDNDEGGVGDYLEKFFDLK